MLKIWGRKNSSNVQKVLWTCAELEVAFERVDWGGPFGGNQDPAYVAMNPNGLVPTVQDGDLVIWESNTIMRWLCATRGGERLHPPDAAQRTHVERWMDWNLSALTPPMSALLLGYYRTPPEKRDATALRRGAPPRRRAVGDGRAPPRRPQLPRRRRFHPGRYRPRHLGASLAHLSDRATRAAAAQSVVRSPRRAGGIPQSCRRAGELSPPRSLFHGIVKHGIRARPYHHADRAQR